MLYNPPVLPENRKTRRAHFGGAEAAHDAQLGEPDIVAGSKGVNATAPRKVFFDYAKRMRFRPGLTRVAGQFCPGRPGRPT